MCGLVGVAGDIGKKEEKAFEMMLVLDSVRGPHSTGVLGVPRFTDPRVVKCVGSPWELFDLAKYTTLMNFNHRVLMGHNRWATKGGITNYNAHPFQFPDIIGAHNGTLRQQQLLDDHAQFEVDSENVFHHMQKNGAEDTIGKLNGAYCLTWWDNKESTMNFIRNDERPLMMCKSADGTNVFWASESWMLSVALSRAGIAYDPIEELPVDQLTTLPIHKDALGINSFGKVRAKEVKGYKPPPLPKWGGNKTHNNVNNGNKGKQCISSRIAPVGEEIEVTVVGAFQTSATLQPYISLLPMDNTYKIPVLRVYPSKGSILWDKLLDKERGSSWLVTVNNYNGSGDYYTGKLGSLVEIPKEEYEDVATIGLSGTEVSEEEWDKYIKEGKGCSWCSEKPKFSHWAEIEWVDEEEYLCYYCTAANNVGNHNHAH